MNSITTENIEQVNKSLCTIVVLICIFGQFLINIHCQSMNACLVFSSELKQTFYMISNELQMYELFIIGAVCMDQFK